jgi:hypothetical protein
MNSDPSGCRIGLPVSPIAVATNGGPVGSCSDRMIADGPLMVLKVSRGSMESKSKDRLRCLNADNALSFQEGVSALLAIRA